MKPSHSTKKQFSDAQGIRQQTFAEALRARGEKASTAHTEWSEKLRAVQTQAKSDFDEALNAAMDEQQTFKKERDGKAQHTLEELDAQLKQAKKIVGLIAGSGMAGGYQRDANSERTAFWIWSVLAVLSFGGLIGFAVSLFFVTTKDPEFSWPHLLGRLVAVAAFGVCSRASQPRCPRGIVRANDGKDTSSSLWSP